MKTDYVFYVYPYNYDPKIHKIEIYVIQGDQPMLDQVVQLTKSNTKFAVFRVGECLGDYS